MILQRLLEYYDRVASQQNVNFPRYGWSRQKVSFCVVLDDVGSFRSFQPLFEMRGTRKAPVQINLPGRMKFSGRATSPTFLWGNAAYMLGFNPKNEHSPRTAQCFAAFRHRHLQLQTEIHSPAFQAVCRFLDSWSPERAMEHESELREMAQSFGVFRFTSGDKFVHEELNESELNNGLKAELETGDQRSAICLVTGSFGPVARLHEPKIKGVDGTLPSGGSLVSFNADAYTSYGKDQSFNSPVSLAAVFKYTNALNSLLEKRERRIMLGDTTLAFWAEQNDTLEQVFATLFQDPAYRDHAGDKFPTSRARRIMSQWNAGDVTSETTANDEKRLFVLGMSPNAARISVRVWIDSDVKTIKRRLRQYLIDIQLGGIEEERLLTVHRLVEATGRAQKWPDGRFKNFDNGTVAPKLAGDCARAILTGGPYPRSLLETMLRRIRMDGVVHGARVAAIKASLARSPRLGGKPMEITSKLNPNESEAAYRFGRLFSVLEKIQRDSFGGEVRTTIKDLYFSGVSTTPQTFLPRLIRLSQHQLSKLDPRLRGSHRQRVREILGDPPSGDDAVNVFPKVMTMEQQAMFVIGYYHQRQDLYTKKSKESGVSR